MQIPDQLPPKGYWIWKLPGCPEGILMPRQTMGFRPEGESDFIYFENPTEEIIRLAKLIPPITYPGITDSHFNCHGAATHVLEGKPLKYIEFTNLQGDEIPIETVEKVFKLPCGFQLWNSNRIIHSGVYLGKHNGKHYIFHKLGSQQSELSEINYGLYYYPNYTHMVFYGNKNLNS